MVWWLVVKTRAQLDEAKLGQVSGTRSEIQVNGQDRGLTYTADGVKIVWDPTNEEEQVRSPVRINVSAYQELRGLSRGSQVQAVVHSGTRLYGSVNVTSGAGAPLIPCQIARAPKDGASHRKSGKQTRIPVILTRK